MRFLRTPRSHAVLRLALAGLILACSSPARAQTSTLPPASPDNASLAVLQVAGYEGRVLWLDGTANLERLSTRAGVAAVMERAAKARFNTVVVDVKPLSGHTLYDSKVAPRLTEWKGFRYPEGHDLLRVALEEGRKHGLKVYANINVFSDGHKLVGSGRALERPELGSVVYDVQRTLTTAKGERKTLAIGVNRQPGPHDVAAYDPGFGQPRALDRGEVGVLVQRDQVVQVVEGPTPTGAAFKIPPDGYLLVGRGDSGRWMLTGFQPGEAVTWAASERLLPIAEAPSETVAAFVNPADPTARDYLWKIVDEIAAYPVDGIVFDRMRYASLHSDFSDLSRQKFEEYLGQRLNRWPQDIYSFDPTPGRGIAWGPYFKQWLEWRARNIRTWAEEACRRFREKRPGGKCAVYVGSWYPTYYTVGVNWGSEEFAPGYDWMSFTYPQTGYARLMDWITTGCYHPIATRQQAKDARLDDSYTVQAAAEMSTRAVGDQAFVYAGLYVLDYRTSPDAFREAIQAARRYSHGVMVFDLTHIEEYGWWSVLEEELQGNRTAPHDVPELLKAVRTVRAALQAGSRGSLP